MGLSSMCWLRDGTCRKQMASAHDQNAVQYPRVNTRVRSHAHASNSSVVYHWARRMLEVPITLATASVLLLAADPSKQDLGLLNAHLCADFRRLDNNLLMCLLARHAFPLLDPCCCLSWQCSVAKQERSQYLLNTLGLNCLRTAKP